MRDLLSGARYSLAFLLILPATQLIFCTDAKADSNNESAKSFASAIHDIRNGTDKKTKPESKVKTIGKFLEGNLTEIQVDYSLVSCQPFGLMCVKEGKSELPARVTFVEPRSFAYQAGLKDNDRILKADVKEDFINLTVNRDGKIYTAKINKTDPQLIAQRAKPGSKNSAFPADIIALDGPLGVLQGRYPNCWFVAAVQALAAIPEGREKLATMIETNGDRSYTVVFPGDKFKRLNVTAELMDNPQFINPTLWGNVIEAASRQRFPDNDAADDPAKGNPKIRTGLQILTGNKADIARPDSTSAEKLEQIIDSCIRNHIPVTIATKGPAENGFLPRIVVPNHAYAVTGYNPDTKMVTLRNPLGDTEQRHTALKKVKRGDFIPTQEIPNWQTADTGAHGIQATGNGYTQISIADLQRYARFISWSSLK